MEEQERLNRMHELYNEFVAPMNGWWTNTEYVHRLESEERDICDDFILGYLYLHLSQPDKGIEMLKKSAEEGNDFAALTLAEEYLRGALLPANVKEAESWYNCYMQMPICKYVLDCIREYDVNGDTKTIYQISCCDVNDSFTSHIFKYWDMPNLGDLKDGEVGIKLFKHLFDMIQWKVGSNPLFKYDEGCFSEYTNSVKDLDFIQDIEEISNAIISYCKVMKPILEDRDWYIYAIENEDDGIKARYESDSIDFDELCKVCPNDPVACFQLIINELWDGNKKNAISLINNLPQGHKDVIAKTIAPNYWNLILSALGQNENGYFELASIDTTNSTLWLHLAENSSDNTISTRAKQEIAEREAAEQASKQKAETQKQEEYIQTVLEDSKKWLKNSCDVIKTIRTSIQEKRYEDAKRLLEEWVNCTKNQYSNSICTLLKWYISLTVSNRCNLIINLIINTINTDRQLLAGKESDIKKIFDRMINNISLEFLDCVIVSDRQLLHNYLHNATIQIPYDRLLNYDVTYLRFFLSYASQNVIKEALRKKADENDMNALYVLAMYEKDINDIIRCAENKAAITIEPSDDEEKALFEKMCYAILNKDGQSAYELGWYELSDEWGYIHGAFAAKRYKKAAAQYAKYFKDWYAQHNITILQQNLPDRRLWQRYSTKAKQGDIIAMLIVADGYMRGVNGVIERNSEEACNFFRKAIVQLEQNK